MGLQFLAAATLFLSAMVFAAPGPVTKKPLPKSIETIVLGLTPEESAQYFMTLSFDFKKSQMKGQFQEATDITGNQVKQKCKFTRSLSKPQIQKIKQLLSKSFYCLREGDESLIVDVRYWQYMDVYTTQPIEDSDHDNLMTLDKYFIDGEGLHKYLCGGQKDVYNYLKSITAPVVPRSCPASYKKIFELH